MDARVFSEYQKARKPYIGNTFMSQSPASYALRNAKMRVWVAQNWQAFKGDTAYSDDGNWRVIIVPDEGCDLNDLLGDMYDPKHCLPIDGGMRALTAQKKAYIEKLERDGVWGIVLEKKVPACDKCRNGERWEHVDSCWGFEYAAIAEEVIPFQYQSKGD